MLISRRIGRRWLRPRLSLALGLPLLLGSTPAAAAGSVGALGSFTTWIGVLAALWAVLGPRQGATSIGTAWIAVVAAVMFLTVWGWRHQRARVGASRRQMSLSPSWASRVAKTVSLPRSTWPEDLDGKQVLEAARSRFLGLQAAWDAGDVQALGHLTTPEMLEQLLPVLDVRGGAPNRTDVITLHAELLGVEEVSAGYLASIEFSGLIRESADEGAVPFRELWMLSSGKDGSPSWRLARQQALF